MSLLLGSGALLVLVGHVENGAAEVSRTDRVAHLSAGMMMIDGRMMLVLSGKPFRFWLLL